MNEEKIRVLSGIIGLMISILGIGASISSGVVSYALYGVGFGTFILGYGLSPKLLLSDIKKNDSAFSKKSSSIVLAGCCIMLMGALIERLS